jgi:hypothetical protein
VGLVGPGGDRDLADGDVGPIAAQRERVQLLAGLARAALSSRSAGSSRIAESIQLCW